jgi:hypothetical protein
MEYLSRLAVALYLVTTTLCQYQSEVHVHIFSRPLVPEIDQIALRLSAPHLSSAVPLADTEGEGRA